MKPRFWLGVITAAMVTLATAHAQTTQSASDSDTAPAVTPAVADVIKMAEGGEGEDVLLAYVQDSSAAFDLSADQILYLRDIGLSSTVISAMLNRDAALKVQVAEQPYPQPDAAPVPAAEAPASPVAPAPNVEQTPAPDYVSNPPEVVSCFYNDLAPYGTWIELDGVGWCWQPRVVVFNPSWRPYCDSGHWVYTDAGWFWQSDYTWGWAPFHYGRWFLQEGCGWVWAPDRVWGPAWVTWRYDGDHCGWAPLPPHADFDLHLGYCFNGVQVGFGFDFGLRPEHFTFISLHDFDDHDYPRRCLPPAQVTRIFNHTTVINNYVVNNNTIVNRGIRVDRVATATHSEIHPLPIHDAPTWSQGPGGRGVTRTEVAVYRPELRPVARPANMVAQKIDARHPTIQSFPLASPTLSRASSRPTSLPFAAHGYNKVEPKHGQAQWASKPNRPEYNSGAQDFANGTSLQSHSAFISRSVPKTPSIKTPSESGLPSVQGSSWGSRTPGIASYNPPRVQAAPGTSSQLAGEWNQRLHTSTQDRATPQGWLARQPAHPGASGLPAVPSRQPQVQLPAVSQAQPSAQSSWSRRETTPSYSALSTAATPFRQSAPATQARSRNPWESSGANLARTPLQQRPEMQRFYAQSGAQSNWRGQSYRSSHGFEPGYARPYIQPSGQFSATSHSPGVAAQTHSIPQWQGNFGANSRGDASKHRNQ